MLIRPTVAIVGARNATMGGAENARAFARYLATHSWCVASGLPQGIDAAAHEGALEAGPQGASTVALMGTGIDLIYPRRCQALAERIAVQGALVSELPLGSPPKPYHFPKRNRLIAGISWGTLVVEASRQSGSLITAQLALENGREVFALPGSIHSPLSRGCHALIQQGATLIENARDILNELHPVTHANVKSNMVTRVSQSESKTDTPHGNQHKPECEPTLHTSSATQHVLAALGYEPVHVDTLVARTQLDSPCLVTELLKLELDGLIERLAGGHFQRLKGVGPKPIC
jgi:DNA processing protein